jgi:predicted SnoaL-like aldol condensation-catalyzing enzyme
MEKYDELLKRVSTLEHKLDVLAEHRVGMLEDAEQIRRIQNSYGYYLDNLLYDQIADLFAEKGAAIEIGRRGRYVGKPNVRKFLRDVLGDGQPGLMPGQVINHTQLQPIVTVAPDRQHAQVRCRAIIQASSPPPQGTAAPPDGATMMWAEGVYENTYVKESGVWKIGLLWWVPTFYVSHPYTKLWFDSTPASTTFPPQAASPPPLEGLGRSFMPFHYRHPITGEAVEPAQVVRSANRSVAPVSYTTTEQANLKLVQDVYEHVLKPLDSSRVDEFFTQDYVQHNPMAATGAAGLKKFLDWARSTSPKAEHRVKRVFADGDHVIAHVHVIINPGEAGNAVVDIFRIANGRIAEHWDVAQPVPAQSANTNGMF